MENKALVLGATGAIGGEMARQMTSAGWRVIALNRRAPEEGELRDGIQWIRGDAMDAASVKSAAQGCDVIVHAVNPPGYRRWGELVLPMIDNTIAAAVEQGATVVLPGTIYNFGPDAFPVLSEDSPQRPVTSKGAIRVEMERRLQAASAAGARVLVVRAGDFFGPGCGNSWFAQGLVRPGRSLRTIALPGDPGVGHLWSYLPDVARTMMQLLERRNSLQPWASFHMGGHWDEDGLMMANAIRACAARRGMPAPRLVRFPWWLVALASPFMPTLRALREMRYLWRTPIRMDNARLVAVLGREPHTPLDAAVEATLESLGSIAALEDRLLKRGRSRSGSGQLEEEALRGG